MSEDEQIEVSIREFSERRKKPHQTIIGSHEIKTRDEDASIVEYVKYLLRVTGYVTLVLDDPQDAAGQAGAPALEPPTTPREAVKEAEVENERIVEEWREQFNAHFSRTELEADNAPCVVMLHGVGRDSSSLEEHIAYFKEKSVKAIALNLPPFGKIVEERDYGFTANFEPEEIESTRYSGQEANFETLADYVVNQLDRLGIEGPVWITGHSQGALIAPYLAKNHHDCIVGFYANSGPIRSGENEVPRKMEKSVEGVLGLYKRFSKAGNVAQKAVAFLRRNIRGFDRIDALELMEKVGGDVLCSCYNSAFKTAWDEVLEGVPEDMPSVFVFGNEDGAVHLLNPNGWKVVDGAIVVHVPGKRHDMISPEDHFRIYATEIARLNEQSKV
jgi:predicted esterase